MNTLKYTDREIIKCLGTGENNKVLNLLYTDVFPKVKAYIISNSGDADDALDIFQDAIIALCKQIKLGKYDTKYEIAGFLYSVGRNLWINKANRDKRSVQMLPDMDVAEDFDFSDDIFTSEKENGLKKVSQLLGGKCYELLKYCIYENAKTDYIIEKMGFTSADAVKTQKYKCKQKLLKILDENPGLRELVE